MAGRQTSLPTSATATKSCQETKWAPYLSHSNQELPRAYAGGAEAALGPRAESLGGEGGSGVLLGHPQLLSSTGAPSRCSRWGRTEGVSRPKWSQAAAAPHLMQQQDAGFGSSKIIKRLYFCKIIKAEMLANCTGWLKLLDTTLSSYSWHSHHHYGFFHVSSQELLIAGFVFLLSGVFLSLSSSYKILSHHSSICLLSYHMRRRQWFSYILSQQTKFHLQFLSHVP